MVLLLAVLVRNRIDEQIVLFLFVCGSALLGGHANAFLGAQGAWRRFGFTQNYFDPSGIFVIVMFMVPLMVIAAGQMLHAFYTATSMMITIKRAQLVQQRQQRAKEEEQAATGTQQHAQAQGQGQARQRATASGQGAKGGLGVGSAEIDSLPKKVQ